MFDKKTKLLLNQEWLTIEDVGYILGISTEKALKICLLKNEKDIILHTKPRYIKIKPNNRFKGIVTHFSKDFDGKKLLDEHKFYALAPITSLKEVIGDLFEKETILNIEWLIDNSNSEHFRLIALDGVYSDNRELNIQWKGSLQTTYIDIKDIKDSIFVKTKDFIEHFSDILDLEPYINEKYKPYSKEKLKEIVNRNIYLDYFDICNLIGKNIGYSYTYTNHNHEITEINTSDTFNLIISKHNSSYTNISIPLNESRINFIPYKDSKPICIYDWDNSKGKYKFKNGFSFGFELFRKNINFDNSLNHQPKPAINQDDSYKYSEALKPYNDIILAFDSEYQRLSNDNIRIQSTNHIQPWLKENYKDLKDHDIRVLNNLIQTHYKLKK
ncbi:hypothetical protein [Francisella hispaniensis]|uniref:Uncharacterized protein n=1 Tax=Francisella hispaniensis TaxID=622488 RepID=F4BI79_9GAMM|nr:hypothetical protein [Francisella hispaniensis]AEB27873.1 conserved hypothetical protein [Francisella hispaniensis]